MYETKPAEQAEEWQPWYKAEQMCEQRFFCLSNKWRSCYSQTFQNVPRLEDVTDTMMDRSYYCYQWCTVNFVPGRPFSCVRIGVKFLFRVLAQWGKWVICGRGDKEGREIFEGPFDVKTHTGSLLFIMKRNSHNELLCVLPLGYNSQSTKRNFLFSQGRI